jgi:hypothetical protein
VQTIITNSTVHKTSHLMNATLMTFGAVKLPDALWPQLPPRAQSAIDAHNNSLTSVHTQTQMNNTEQVISAIRNSALQVFEPAPPSDKSTPPGLW